MRVAAAPRARVDSEPTKSKTTSAPWPAVAARIRPRPEGQRYGEIGPAFGCKCQRLFSGVDRDHPGRGGRLQNLDRQVPEPSHPDDDGRRAGRQLGPATPTA